MQYADPFTRTSTFTSASAAVPSTAYTSFTACDASTITGGAAASSTARNPDTCSEYCPPDSVRSPRSSLCVSRAACDGPSPFRFVQNNSALATRASASATGNVQLPLYGLPKNSGGNGAIAVFRSSVYTVDPAACDTAPLSSMSRVTS